MCFAGSGLEEVRLPASVRVVATGAFSGCDLLRHVELNEGLLTLGGEWRGSEKSSEGTVFARSWLESIRIPSTLRAVEAGTFFHCVNLRRVELPEGLERIGAAAFQGSGVEEVVLPASVR